MSRRTILILVAIILVAIGIWVYVSYKSAPGNSDGTNPNSLGSLFPFGGTAALPGETTTPGSTDGGNGTTPGTSATPKRLTKITSRYVAGYTALPTSAILPVADITDDTGTQTLTPLPVVRFAERGTGYVYDADAKGNGLRKTSGTVIAHALIALFGDNGDTVIFRYIKNDNKTIATYLGRIVPTTATSSYGETVGSFLADNITDLVLSQDKKSAFYVAPTDTGSAGFTVKTDGTGQKQLFSSPFSEWLADWPTTGPVVTTKASANVPGYAYSITGAGNLDKIIGNVSGLTTKMSPDGKGMLYSVTASSGRMSLHVKNITTGADTDTGLSTLPEKCAWNTAGSIIYCGVATSIPAGKYPDSWYQGVTHFNDMLWQIEAKTGATTRLSDGEGNVLDVTQASLDEKEQYLFFVNKNDASLWSFDLKTTPTDTTSALPTVQ